MWPPSSICSPGARGWLAFRGPAAKPSHLRRKAALIDEDQACGIKIMLVAEPILARSLYISTLLLAGVGGLFLCVRLCRSRNFHAWSSPRSRRVPPATARPSRQELCRAPLQCAQDEIRMGIQHRSLRLTLFGRTNVPGGPLQPRPHPGRRNPDRKPRGRLMRLFAAFDRRNDPLTQIHTVRFAHSNLPTHSRRWNQHSAPKRIPPARFLRNLL
jgi:hypothetical protein